MQKAALFSNLLVKEVLDSQWSSMLVSQIASLTAPINFISSGYKFKPVKWLGKSGCEKSRGKVYF